MSHRQRFYKPNTAILRLPVFPTEVWKDQSFGGKDEVDYELSLMNVILSLTDTLVQLIALDLPSKGDTFDSPSYLHKVLDTDRLTFLLSIIQRLRLIRRYAHNSPALPTLQFLQLAVDGKLPGYCVPFAPSTYEASMFGFESEHLVAALSNKNTSSSSSSSLPPQE